MSDYLIHWETKEDHKYVARVKISGGKYRYFYTNAAYKAYLAGNSIKSFVGKTASTLKSVGQSAGKTASTLKSVGKSVSKTAKSIGKTTKSFVESGKSSIKSLSTKLSSATASQRKVLISSGKSAIASLKKTGSMVSSKVASGLTSHKYVAKVKTGSGFRYFYSNSEYQAYLKVKQVGNQKLESFLLPITASKFINATNFVSEMATTLLRKVSPSLDAELDEHDAEIKKYQDNEPDFMKNLPEISNTHTKELDMSEINENYNYGGGWTINCATCTAAYELRRRGYDVQSVYNDGNLDTTLEGIASWYDNAEIQTPYGKYPLASNYTNQSEYDKDVEEWYSKITTTISYNDFNNFMTEAASTPNSRGQLTVYWNVGGGHSVAYDTDKDGNITIRDCQVNKSYTIDEWYSHYGQYMYAPSIMRTDNLEVSKNILNVTRRN